MTTKHMTNLNTQSVRDVPETNIALTAVLEEIEQMMYRNSEVLTKEELETLQTILDKGYK